MVAPQKPKKEVQETQEKACRLLAVNSVTYSCVYFILYPASSSSFFPELPAVQVRSYPSPDFSSNPNFPVSDYDDPTNDASMHHVSTSQPRRI